MNKIKRLIIMVMLAILLIGCGKSVEVENFEVLVNQIGKVTVDSENAISAAEEAYKQLDDKDKAREEVLASKKLLEVAKENYEKIEVIKETDYVTIDGICVDDTYETEQNSSLKLVYLFLTLKANDKNLDIDSVYMNLKVGESNIYTSQILKENAKFIKSYLYSSYVEEIFTGENKKILVTFLIPKGDLEKGKRITLEDPQIPDIDKIKFNTDEIKHFNGPEEVAIQMDPKGYKEINELKADADKSTVDTVKSLINGYTFSVFTNMTTYNLSFEADNNFTMQAAIGSSALPGQSGTYSVKKGYIFCTYNSNGVTLEIPYKIENGKINLDIEDAVSIR